MFYTSSDLPLGETDGIWPASCKSLNAPRRSIAISHPKSGPSEARAWRPTQRSGGFEAIFQCSRAPSLQQNRFVSVVG